jgi:hypothetical protein
MNSEAAAQFDIGAARANLSRIIERAERGEEIIISRAGIPPRSQLAGAEL